MMNSDIKTRRPARIVWTMILTVALSAIAVSAQASDEAHWTPHRLHTTPPPARPLGCRHDDSELNCKPSIDVSDLPPVDTDGTDVNPYHGDAAVAATGQKIFNQACAYCHGKDADNEGAIGADLMQLDSGCVSVTDETLLQRCQSDVNAFFVHRVRNGKATFGIVHMPPWEGILSLKEIWAIRTFIEARSRE